ncbi:MAG: hypothetical protein NVS3B6_22530 [Pseudarthrobacter sp.]
MTGPAVGLVSLLALAGCAAGPAAGGKQAAGDPSPASSVAAAPPAGAAGAGSPALPSPSDIPAGAAGGPSAAAKMVCGEETRANIVRILALPATPGTTDTWADKLYTCTYALPAGSLVLSVKEAADPAAARAYFDSSQKTTAQAAPIEGLTNLGFPAYESPASAVFVKDSFVLTVDAAALPATVGPHNVSRSAFAYEVAAAILACWSE